MSPEWTGAGAGLLFGVISYITLATVADKMAQDRGDAEKQRHAKILKMVARFEILLFTIVGYFVGPMILQ